MNHANRGRVEKSVALQPGLRFPVLTPESDLSDADDEVATDAPRCPVCGASSKDSSCPHLVSSCDYSEESGEWAADPHPLDLREAVGSLLDALAAGFTEQQQAVIAALLALPAEVTAPLAWSVRDGDFGSAGVATV